MFGNVLILLNFCLVILMATLIYKQKSLHICEGFIVTTILVDVYFTNINFCILEIDGSPSLEAVKLTK